MMTKSPSGALSPYYYKGGFFHGIHYGSYFDDSAALLTMMELEEAFLLKSPEKRRILIDLYETKVSDQVLERLTGHIQAISPRVVKLAIASDKKSLRRIRKAIEKNVPLGSGQLYFCPDMEAGKTWLVQDSGISR